MGYTFLSNLPNDFGLAIDLDTNQLARWNGKDFIPLSGEGGGSMRTGAIVPTDASLESASGLAVDQASINQENAEQIKALSELENKLENAVNTMTHPASVFNQPFANATFDGTVNAIAVDINDSITIVSFWGSATQNSAGSAGESFVVLDPTTYTLLQRFVGQVDQWARGYNANVGAFSDMPVRITASEGIEIVTPPNIAAGTIFSWQFVLVLAAT